jgi:hypothetical protein
MPLHLFQHPQEGVVESAGDKGTHNETATATNTNRKLGQERKALALNPESTAASASNDGGAETQPLSKQEPVSPAANTASSTPASTTDNVGLAQGGEKEENETKFPVRFQHQGEHFAQK